MSTEPTPAGPTRADARNNRTRILEVAGEVFGRGGAAASTEEVARLAGVGIATVFRHFPTKRELLEEVLARHFGRLCDRAEALAGAEDAGRAFFELFGEIVADASGKLAIVEAFTDAGGDVEGRAGRASLRLRELFGDLLRRAQDAGAVRADAGLDEVYALLIGASRATVHARLDERVRARALAIIFGGLSTGEEVQSGS